MDGGLWTLLGQRALLMLEASRCTWGSTVERAANAPSCPLDCPLGTAIWDVGEPHSLRQRQMESPVSRIEFRRIRLLQCWLLTSQCSDCKLVLPIELSPWQHPTDALGALACCLSGYPWHGWLSDRGWGCNAHGRQTILTPKAEFFL